ncbi:MAG TPA: STAS/SEC14 domain-containing protein [Anaerolineae bacterium]|nr:STAS/SEC14 domain-containing protein [Anaerolineae bacterium]
MFSLLERSTENCIGLEVSGTVKAGDYDNLTPIINNAVKANNTINMVLEMDDFDGYQDIDAVIADVEMGLETVDDIEKVAIVSDAKWQEMATKLLSPLTRSTQIKHFDKDARDQAWAWTCGSDWVK